MRRKISILLVLAIVATFCLSFMTIEASGNSAGKWESGEEYLSVGKDTFKYGEAIFIKYKLNEAEAKRMCVVYKDLNSNGVIDGDDHPYWYQGAGSTDPWALLVPHDGGGILDAAEGVDAWGVTLTEIPVGSYVVTFRVYARDNSKGNCGYANYVACSKSDVEVPFKVVENTESTAMPTISIAETTVAMGGKIAVSYDKLYALSAIGKTAEVWVRLYDANNEVADEIALWKYVYVAATYTGSASGVVEFDTELLDEGTYTVKLESNSLILNSAPIQVTVEAAATPTPSATPSTTPSAAPSATPGVSNTPTGDTSMIAWVAMAAVVGCVIVVMKKRAEAK
ncbi:MAG: hypothetical protein IKU26_07690 [Clostridia bacterium]|nr:hypothetical protein [Clostridia bacterium]